MRLGRADVIDMGLVGGIGIADEIGPDAAWGPNFRHCGAGVCFGYAEMIAAIAIEKGGCACIEDAVNVHDIIADAVQGADKFFVICFKWRIKGDGDVDIVEAQRLHRGAFVGQGAGVAVEPQIDDMLDAQCGKLPELGFVGLARCGQSIIQTQP